MDLEYKDSYSFTNKQFLLSPDGEILRTLACSLYPSYLSRMLRDNKPVEPHPIPALDKRFVASSEALWFRVLSETIYTEIVLQQQKIHHTVLWFGSARIGTPNHQSKPKIPDYYQQAQDLAEKLTRWALSLKKEKAAPPFVICTGGGPGIMEAGNRGAHKAGGESIGLNIQLPAEQKHNPYIGEEMQFNFQYFFTRKYHFLKRAKVAVVFPGGFGSMDELFETLTLVQTRKINPLKIILFGTEFWKNVICMDKLVEYGTISEKDLDLFEYHDQVETAFQAIAEELKRVLKL
ncbi:LOG family protein [Deltaproteobacteria bacterium TL4]